MASAIRVSKKIRMGLKLNGIYQLLVDANVSLVDGRMNTMKLNAEGLLASIKKRSWYRSEPGKLCLCFVTEMWDKIIIKQLLNP
jgi:hypothetical protein